MTPISNTLPVSALKEALAEVRATLSTLVQHQGEVQHQHTRLLASVESLSQDGATERTQLAGVQQQLEGWSQRLDALASLLQAQAPSWWSLSPLAIVLITGCLLLGGIGTWLGSPWGYLQTQRHAQLLEQVDMLLVVQWGGLPADLRHKLDAYYRQSHVQPISERHTSGTLSTDAPGSR
jgi:hypothetical protein